MLILTRRTKETLLIGRNVKVTVLAASDNQVTLGINAPKTLETARGDLQEKEKDLLSKDWRD